MSNAKKLSTTVTTPEFRVSYPNVFKAKLNKLSGKMEFSVQALFEKDMKDPIFASLKAAAHVACADVWGEDQTKWPKLANNPFKDQVDKEKEGKMPEGHKAGNLLMTFKSEARPGLVDENLQEIMDQSKFYGGCYARASVNAFAYPKKGTIGIKPGVSFGLNHIQFMRDGAPFSGRPKVEDAFTPITPQKFDHKDESSVFD